MPALVVDPAARWTSTRTALSVSTPVQTTFQAGVDNAGVRLLERETQVAALLGYAAEAAAGTGRLVLVEGEAGVGKSTLVERLESRLPGARWLWGACEALGTPRPLSPLRDVAQQTDGPLLDALRSGAAREDVFSALLDTLRLGGQEGTVVVLEDVHWADDATLDLLRFLGRRVQRLPTLVLVTFRDDERSPPLRLALGDLSRQRAVRRVTLPPLTEGAVAHLVGATGLDAAEVYRRTGGNPFFVAEVLAQPDQAFPVSVRDSVLGRLAGLDGACQLAAEAAALVGLRVDPELLAGVLGDADPCVDALVEAGLLTGDVDSLRWRHDIARLAVADSVAPLRRRALHARVLASLLERGEDDEATLAFHAGEAGNATAVLAHAPKAAAHAAGLAAHREAIEHYRHALAFALEAAPDARARLHDALAGELAMVDHWEEAAAQLEAAIGLWRVAGDPLRTGDSLRRRSHALWRLSRGQDSDAVAAEALHLLEPLGRTPELARALKHRAGSLMLTDQHREAIRMAEQAALLAEDLDLPDVLSDALDTLACSLSVLGEPWEDTMRRALQVALDGGCAEQAARAYTNFYGQYLEHHRAAEGERVYLDGVAYAEEHDAATFGNCLAASRVEALESLGRWDEALALGWERVGVVTMSPINELHFLLGLSRIAARRGDERAGELLDRAVRSAHATGEPQWRVPLHLARTEWHWLAGRTPEAQADLREALTVATTLHQRSMAAVWALRTGLATPVGELAEPWASSVEGRPRAAAAAWESLGDPYQSALALLDSSDPADWAEAFTRFDRLGAAPAARLARQRLRGAGVRALPRGVRAATRQHPAGLTAREQEVLDLIRDGATNEEIARSLVISVRTAGHHVSAVLTKLGVPDRRQAADEAERLGLRRHGEVLGAT